MSVASPAPIPASELHPGTITRNLIGDLVVSAFKLRDTEDQLGIWSVLSDLSVRTAGVFRLKFSFFNLTADQENLLDKGSLAMVCTDFSSPFIVYPAKTFPGMIASTELSRRFAAQGVKIAIRSRTRKAQLWISVFYGCKVDFGWFKSCQQRFCLPRGLLDVHITDLHRLSFEKGWHTCESWPDKFMEQSRQT